MRAGYITQNASFKNNDLDPRWQRTRWARSFVEGLIFILFFLGGYMSASPQPPPVLWPLPHAFFKLPISTFSSPFPGKPSERELGGAYIVDLGVEWSGKCQKETVSDLWIPTLVSESQLWAARISRAQEPMVFPGQDFTSVTALLCFRKPEET